MFPTVGDDDLLAEQQEYYRARAGSYESVGDQPGGPVDVAAFLAERDQVLGAFDALDLGADVLELAGGTGIWTRRIVERRATRAVTVVDSSVEMVTANLSQLGSSANTVRFVISDIFAWKPDHSFDSVVFCYWLSHVPESRMESFLDMVARALKPGGSLFFVDDKAPTRPGPPSDPAPPGWSANDDEVRERRTPEGKIFRIVKRYWEPGDLRDRCARAGLDVAVTETAGLFQYGVGRRA